MSTQVNGHTSKPVDVLLIGLGSIGSVYAFLLERTGRARVTAVARSNYKLYNETGVLLKTTGYGDHENWKPYRVCKSQEEALEGDVHYDFCINCTKFIPDSLTTEKLLGPAIASKKIGAWVLIQNGLGVEEGLYQAVKDQGTPLISAVAWIGIMTSPAGDVVSWAMKETMVAGIYPPLPPPTEPQTRSFSEKEKAALDLFVDLVTTGGGNIYAEDRITSIRFSKNVWNCAWSTMEGLMRTTPHTFEPLSDHYRQPLKNFIREIVDTGFKSGLLYEGMTQYPDKGKGGSAEATAQHCWDRIYNMSITKYNSGMAPHRMSLLIDLEMGRPTEVEAITGEVLRLAESHGIPTPLLGFAYALLKGTQLETFRRLQGKGAILQ